MTDPYVYPGTDCLKNKLRITDAAELAVAEARVVSIRDVATALETIPGAYNLSHLQMFHKRLFGDIYTWAGCIRTVDISREQNIRFCHFPFIAENVSAVLAELDREDHLAGSNHHTFVRRLAYYYGELNVCHPFREGNGRTTRAFLRQLGAAAGFLIDWSELNAEGNVEACRHNMITGKTDLLEAALWPVVRRM